MKKFAKIMVAVCLMCASLMLFACGGITTEDGGTKVYNANITSWYSESPKLLDTSVTLNFDEIQIGEVSKITFELYKDETKLGDAVSEGEKLVNLFNEAKIYWEKSAGVYYAETDDYKTITGNGRILSCAFKTLTQVEEGDCWVRSANTASEQNDANKLVVKVLVNNVEYTTSFLKNS